MEGLKNHPRPPTPETFFSIKRWPCAYFVYIAFLRATATLFKNVKEVYIDIVTPVCQAIANVSTSVEYRAVICTQ